MGGSVIFYTYGSILELNGQQLTAGMLTADLLNLSPDEYMRLKKRMTQITDLAEEYERKRDVALWWKLNEKMDALCQSTLWGTAPVSGVPPAAGRRRGRFLLCHTGDHGAIQRISHRESSTDSGSAKETA